MIPQPRPAPGDPDTPGPSAASVTTAIPPRCPTRTSIYRRGALLDEGFPAEQIGRRLADDPEAVVWLDLFDPDEADLQLVVDEFGLHPLAVEDAVADRQRPKLDRYRTHLFLNMYAATFDPDRTEVATSEISAFITRRALVTVRKAAFDIDALVARWDGSEGMERASVGFLLHGLLDAVVDGQSQAVDEIGAAVDDLEECLFDHRGETDIRRQGFDLRKSLVRLRRVVAPMREIVRQLLHAGPDVVPDTLAPYYQDVYDHALSASEGVETARDLIASITDASLNEQSYSLNEITKKLASWAAIIAVPTAVTGFYGQNVPYPGFSKEWGFITSVGVMVTLAGGLFLLLRRRGWL